MRGKVDFESWLFGVVSGILLVVMYQMATSAPKLAVEQATPVQQNDTILKDTPALNFPKQPKRA